MEKPIIITCINCSKDHIYELCRKGYIVKEVKVSSNGEFTFKDKVKEYIIKRKII